MIRAINLIIYTNLSRREVALKASGTAVVRLAENGCTIPEISAITGHRIDDTAQILEVYMPRTSDMAANAIAKLEKGEKLKPLFALNLGN